MPKNKGAGGKGFKKGKKSDGDEEVRELIFKEDGQEYAQVIKKLGGCKIEVQCIDGAKRTGIIRNKLYKKVWLLSGDIILVSLRDYEQGVVDIIHKYLPNEVKNLKIYGEIPQTITTGDNTESQDNDIRFEIQDENESEESD